MAETGERFDSSAKCGECGSPVSADTPLTEALKINFDHCAGRASGQRLGLQASGFHQFGGLFYDGEGRVARFERTDPGCGVEFDIARECRCAWSRS